MIKKKSILSTLLLIIPMLVAIGFSTWIIIYEVLIRPNYIAPSGLSKFFDNAQTTYYNGVIQLPEQTSGDEIPSELLSYYYKLESESDENYELCTDTVGPKNAGTYSVLVTKTESEVVESCLVTLTIEKATPSIEKPTIIPGEIYEGQNAAYYGGVAYLENEYFPEGKEIIVQGSFSYTSSKGTSELKYSGTGEKSENKVNMTFTPQNGVEDGAINFKSVNFQVDLKLLHIAYISGDSGKLFFGSIESALDYANSTKDSSMKNVIVVPELKEEDEDGNEVLYSPVIRSNCTIKSGVALTLPFEGETFDGRQRGAEGDNGSYFADDVGDYFADKDESFVDTYLMTNIIIDKNVSLTIEDGGTLNIGGITGNEADPGKTNGEFGNTDDVVLCGQTSGKYCQITMDSNSKIISDGAIYCYGYIKELSKDNGSIIEVNSGTINLPFVLYDYQGGWETIGSFCTSSSGLTEVNDEASVNLLSLLSGTPNGNVSPFSIYDLPNIQSLIKFSCNANMIGHADIYSRATSISVYTVPNTHNATEVKVLGKQNSMINLSSGSYALLKYDNDLNNYTLNDGLSGRTNIKIYGGASSGEMALNVKAAIINVNVTTEHIFFPVSWKFDIELYDGDYSIVNKIKFMNGSRLYVGSSASISIDADTSIYQATSVSNFIYPATQKSKNANFTIDGKAKINAPFSGEIKSNTVDAFLEISNDTNAFSIEGVGAQKDSMNSKFTVSLVVNHNMQGTINLNEFSDFSIGAYISEYQKDVNGEDKLTWTIAEGYTDYSITYDANGGSFSGNTTKTESYLIKDGTTVKVSNITSSEPTRDHYTFEGWYTVATNPEEKDLLTNVYVTDPAGTTKAETIIAYAKWTEKTYTIKYEINYQGEAEKTNQINNNTSEYKYSSTSISFSLPTDVDYRFSGWYIDEDYQNHFDISKSYSGSELFAKADAEGLLTLYGYFTDLVEYTVNFDTDIDDIKYSSIFITKNDIIKEFETNYCNQLKLKNCDVNFPRYFVGWYTDSTYTTKFEKMTPIKSNMTLYAKWLDKKSLTYQKIDSVETVTITVKYYITPEMVDYNLESQDITLTNPNIPGYIFNHKWIDNNKNSYVDSSITINTFIEQEVVLLADITLIAYTLSFSGNNLTVKVNGSSATNGQTIYYTDKIEVSVVGKKGSLFSSGASVTATITYVSYPNGTATITAAGGGAFYGNGKTENLDPPITKIIGDVKISSNA